MSGPTVARSLYSVVVVRVDIPGYCKHVFVLTPAWLSGSLRALSLFLGAVRHFGIKLILKLCRARALPTYQINCKLIAVKYCYQILIAFS